MRTPPHRWSWMLIAAAVAAIASPAFPAKEGNVMKQLEQATQAIKEQRTSEGLKILHDLAADPKLG